MAIEIERRIAGHVGSGLTMKMLTLAGIAVAITAANSVYAQETIEFSEVCTAFAAARADEACVRVAVAPEDRSLTNSSSHRN
jgi:hypothetical protein